MIDSLRHRLPDARLEGSYSVFPFEETTDFILSVLNRHPSSRSRRCLYTGIERNSAEAGRINCLPVSSPSVPVIINLLEQSASHLLMEHRIDKKGFLLRGLAWYTTFDIEDKKLRATISGRAIYPPIPLLYYPVTIIYERVRSHFFKTKDLLETELGIAFP